MRRNAFAHGEMIVDFKSKTAFICHISKKQTRYPSTPEFLKDFQSRINYLSMSYMWCEINLAIKMHK